MAWWLDFLVDEDTQFAECVDGMEAQREGEDDEANHDDVEEGFAESEEFAPSRRLMTVDWEHVEAFDAVSLLLGVQRRVDWR